MAMNAFSIDLEDWFHLLDTDSAPHRDTWSSLEGRVERNTHVLLDELRSHSTKATFFVLGWIADQYPDLLRQIASEGHEIASHGYAHELVYEIGQDAFRDDLKRSKDAIQRAVGVTSKGYRAPGFSITKETPWAFDVLAEEGFEYDSSVFPSARAHGGIPGATRCPSRLACGLIEFPISSTVLTGKVVTYLGGGYLRVLPSPVLLALAKRQSGRDEPLVLYLHPRDIDPGQPRIPLPTLRRYRTYCGLSSAQRKVRLLIEQFTWHTFAECSEQYRTGNELNAGASGT